MNANKADEKHEVSKLIPFMGSKSLYATQKLFVLQSEEMGEYCTLQSQASEGAKVS